MMVSLTKGKSKVMIVDRLAIYPKSLSLSAPCENKISTFIEKQTGNSKL